MSAPGQIDYDALAAQHGGAAPQGMDYDALAAQHGGQSGAPAPASATSEEKEGFWKAIGSDIWNMAKSLPDLVKHGADPKVHMQQASDLILNYALRQGRGESLPYRAAAGVAELGGVNVQGMEQAARQGDPGAVAGHALAMPAVMAATEGAGRLLPKVAPSIAERLRASSVEQYQKALNPTKERTKFLAQKRVPEMIERRITAESPRALRDLAGEKASAATRQLNDIYESLPANRQSRTAPMIDALEQYKQQFQDRLPVSEEQLRSDMARNRGQVPADIVQGPDGSMTRIVNLKPEAVQAAQALQDTIKQYGDSISPTSMRKARQIFDESVARAGGYEGRSLPEGSLLDARKEAATAIREQLAKDNPELVPLNAEVNFWLDVQRIAKETARRRVGQQGGLSVQLAKQGGRIVGGGIGYGAGGPIPAAAGAYFGGEIAAKMARVTQSTKWRTVSAITKNRVADMLAEGNMRAADSQIRFLAAKLGIPLTAGVGKAATEQQSNEPQ